ncbi:UrcA family protein [Peristeroidobacter agariperforans]|uniref:UrcA family protein n=1 Tax=Peristeroidobacter agariperforans TaxID=268404 RepID=UPI0013008AA4|nr:UrcA family protein [Peristeroidobacter agariperforans]
MNAAKSKSAVSLTLAAALVGPFAVAHADRVGQLEGTPKIVVNYEDVDISNSQGLATLYSRIQYAAMDICDYDRLHKELSRQRRPEACYRAAVDDAIKQVNQPVLTAYHRTKSKSIPG